MRIIAAIGLALAAPAVVAQTSTTAPARPSPTSYRISPGDQIDIYVWGDERLQRSLAVLPDGSFAFPLAGTVSAAGRTPPEVEGELSKLLAPQYKDVPPQVTISVRAPTGMQISIIGKVRSPGNLTPTRYIDVLGALAMAGGPTDFADVSGIIVLRRQGDRTIVIRSRLNNILKGHPSAEDLSSTAVPQLQAGDTVVVP
jgi:polysaccharide export outer membrane protein